MAQYSFCNEKGKSALKFLKDTEKFFIDYEQIEQCVGLIITKMEPDTTVKDTLEYLNDDEKINRTLWLKFFLEHPEICFHVFKPINLGPYTDFLDKNRIVPFLESGEVENPRHGIIPSIFFQIHSIIERERYEELRENLQQFSYWILLVKRVLFQALLF